MCVAVSHLATCLGGHDGISSCSCMRPLLPMCAGVWAKVAAFHLRQADAAGRCHIDIIQVLMQAHTHMASAS